MPAERVPSHQAYRVVREHVAALVLDDPGQAGSTVPACPEWTVRELVAHLAGNCASTLGEPRPDGGDLGALVAGWRDTGERLDRLAAAGLAEIGRLLMDAFTHELDLRSALGAPPPPEDHPAYPWAFDIVVGGLAWSIGSRGLPALRLACEDGTWVAGEGPPVATLRAPRHDLYRSLTGRRTPAQVAALDWSADPARWLPAFSWGPFALPDRPAEAAPPTATIG